MESNSIMTPEEFEAKMKEIDAIIPYEKQKNGKSYDREDAHLMAEDVICELLKSLGYEKGVEIFKSIHKGYC